jgi:DNA-binding IclR family transcriptional regulator
MTAKGTTDHRGLPRARGIDRVIHVLDYLHAEGRPMRPNEIAAGVGAPKSTIYEIVHSLLAAHLLEPFDADGRVFLGRRLHYYGTSYLKTFDLTREAAGFLSSLSEATGETAQLCLNEDGQYTVALMKEGARHFKIRSDLGQKMPLPWTASGRLLAAGTSDAEILAGFTDCDFRLPDGRQLAPERFLEEVRQARRDGYFLADNLLDNFARCLAAPVHDHSGACIATLCLVVPRQDAAQRHEALLAALMQHANALSTLLGAAPAEVRRRA